MGTTKNRLLDLTRLVSRAGRPLTGVDRVEYAYLCYLLDDPSEALFGLVRTSLGYVLLDQTGCEGLRHRIQSNQWGAAGPLARLAQRRDPMRARAEADLRRICLARCLPAGLPRMLARHMDGPVIYINTGHSNLTERVTHAIRKMPEARIAVLLHDTIPMDHPQYQRPGAPERFLGFLTRVIAQADLVICNSDQTQRDLERHAGIKTPRTVVAHLGVDRPVAGTPPDGPWSGKPYFVCLGTIEPRKNHALLLDIWERIPNAHLLICGHRGWNNDAVFAQLDARPERVHELPGLPDDQVFGLIRGARALLFPSHAEGYGLPPIEAASLGTPVICNDVPIYREVLGDIPIYVNVSQGYIWAETIKRLANEQTTQTSGAKGALDPFDPPSWDAHFKTVLSLI
jgi:glycosyltransferase involved in cell wall biosynthesis